MGKEGIPMVVTSNPTDTAAREWEEIATVRCWLAGTVDHCHV
ncbi:hypothetical protein A2U01_0112827, partial [Trifolium medium]|nr:hypothetical protein [Trifolium medium]